MSDTHEFTVTGKSAHEHAKYVIAATLEREGRGRANAIPSRDLAARTPVSASTVRDLIKEIRREYKLPVGNSNGYFLIEDDAEAQRQIERQLDQARTSKETAADISAAWNTRRSDG